MSQTFEPGRYLGRVTRWGLVKAKTETPQFALTFTPLGRINPQNPDGDILPCPDLDRTIFRSITKATAQWLVHDLKTMFEYPHDRFGPLDPEAADAYDFRDREFQATLTYEEYEGKTREKWNFATSGQLTGDPLTATDVRKLDTLFGAGKPKRNGRKPRSTTPAPESVPPTVPTVESGAPPAPAAPVSEAVPI